MKTASGILVLILITTTSFAFKGEAPGKLLLPTFKEAPECGSRPEFLSEIRSDFSSSLNTLPQTLLVARDVEFYVEGTKNNEPVKLHGYQSLLNRNASPRVLCGQSNVGNERFSLVAPTLIDTHKKPRVGQSLWQFQMMSEAGRYSFWNFRSPSYGSEQNVEALLKASGATYKVYQRSHDEFELLVTKKEGGVTQYLSIRYDAIANLGSHNQ